VPKSGGLVKTAVVMSVRSKVALWLETVAATDVEVASVRVRV